MADESINIPASEPSPATAPDNKPKSTPVVALDSPDIIPPPEPQNNPAPEPEEKKKKDDDSFKFEPKNPVIEFADSDLPLQHLLAIFTELMKVAKAINEAFEEYLKSGEAEKHAAKVSEAFTQLKDFVSDIKSSFDKYLKRGNADEQTPSDPAPSQSGQPEEPDLDVPEPDMSVPSNSPAATAAELATANINVGREPVPETPTSDATYNGPAVTPPTFGG